MHSFANRLATLCAQIRAAEERSRRPQESCELLAVSKGASAEQVAEAIDAGQLHFGENRVQELEEKRARVAILRPSAKTRWELIGPLQSNKVRRAIAAADRITSVDRFDLLVKLVEVAREVPGVVSIGLQVNSDEDTSKSGFAPASLRMSIPDIAQLVRGTNVVIDGLMMIGRITEDRDESRRSFATFSSYAALFRDEAAAAGLTVGPLISAGMSGDFEIAVEEGATQVRLGSALFGTRG